MKSSLKMLFLASQSINVRSSCSRGGLYSPRWQQDCGHFFCMYFTNFVEQYPWSAHCSQFSFSFSKMHSVHSFVLIIEILNNKKDSYLQSSDSRSNLPFSRYLSRDLLPPLQVVLQRDQSDQSEPQVIENSSKASHSVPSHSFQPVASVGHSSLPFEYALPLTLVESSPISQYCGK